ncbi:tyrosine-type recombinase/integrase [Polaribacter sp. IC073]|uniref:tyrosine-type recombinase/integrase n=1 Tax=Polaribacter sp. IC073 TaxID=2508540 RepID=UPI0011BF042D|nr:tyrosine-type recombinase/integrase [Polaribacter sp. IC073]TXD49194.1 tyrosine-type recombinase/integrase [Polaribacter sp. IC073]
MASISYRLKTDSEWNSIYLRFKQGNSFDYEIKTDLKAPKNRWSKPKQEILSTTKLSAVKVNLKLKELKNHIIKEYEDSKTDGTIISTKWLKEKIASFLNTKTNNAVIDDKIFFVNFIDSYIKKSNTRKTKKNTPVAKRTIQHYETTKRKVQSLENKINKRLKIIDIDLDFHSAFLNHLREEQHLKDSTIGGYIDDIRAFCRNADNTDIKVSNDYKLSEFFSPSYETNDIYLTTKEINKIYETHIENEKLSNAKDWLIIGLYTGLRVSDLLKLTKKDRDEEFIYKKTLKTKFPVIIPIHKHVKEILNKRNNNFPKRISDQKLNDYIKIVCELAGITEIVEGAKMCPKEIEENGKKKIIHRKKDGKFPKFELVTSHTCRRSFASNLYGKLDTLTIMNITGHKTESQFLDYIKITPKEYANKLKSYWENHKDLFE